MQGAIRMRDWYYVLEFFDYSSRLQQCDALSCTDWLPADVGSRHVFNFQDETGQRRVGEVIIIVNSKLPIFSSQATSCHE
jgi:hypothetical protein